MNGYDLAMDMFHNIGKDENCEISPQDAVRMCIEERNRKMIEAAQTIQDICQYISCDNCPFSCYDPVDWKRLYKCKLHDRTPYYWNLPK